MRIKNDDLKKKLELAVEKFKKDTEESVTEMLEDVQNDIEHEIQYRTEYFLKELLIDLGLEKRPKMTITQKQIKAVLDEHVRPALLEQVYRDSPILTGLKSIKRKYKKEKKSG